MTTVEAVITSTHQPLRQSDEVCFLPYQALSCRTRDEIELKYESTVLACRMG